jgi:hypothetical protein
MMKFVDDGRGPRMSYQEEDRSRLRRQASKQAITLAMEGKWREAVAVNRSIIETFPNDVEALNRLGRAYLELGVYSLSEEAYRRTGEIDPHNVIARKNMQRLSRLKETAIGATAGADRLEPQSFIEETGKAGVVRLVDPAPPEVVVRMAAGDQVQLRIDGSTLVAENSAGEYLGKVEPEYGQRLARLAQGGNRYSAVVVSSTEDVISIIIREVYQHPSQSGRLSFPAQGRSGGRTGIGDRVLRRELEQEGNVTDDPGYTVVGGGEETELLVEESPDDEDVDEEV